jgi:antitoxin (DNA-binding transcriptional repressor) of toxin-antitoxin stability system
MRYLRASDARRRWFELLDEVIAGEEVVIERKGHRIVLRSDTQPARDGIDIPDYSDVLETKSLDRADRWGWEWTPESVELRDRK